MAKLSEVLKSAVENNNWTPICDLYFQMTGEEIYPPASKIHIPTPEEIGQLDVASMGADFNIDIEMEEDKLEEEEEDEDEEDDAPVAPTTKKTNDFSDFIATSKGKRVLKDSGEEDEEGRVKAKKVPMGEPIEEQFDRKVAYSKLGLSKKGFKDNGKIFADQSIKANPNDPTLGVFNPMRRGNRAAASDELEDFSAPDTGKFINVECSLCGNHLQVAPALASGYRKKGNTFTCNDCNTSAGRIKIRRQENSKPQKRDG